MSTTRNTQIGAVTAVVLLVYTGQMSLNPVIAPLSREVGLSELQIGSVVSTAAVLVVLLSQFWGRRAQALGARRVLRYAVGIALVAMIGFVAAAWVGVKGLLGVGVVFALFLVLRGVIFGGAIAAVPATAQTYVARVTTTEQERVKGMAGIGAAQGVSMVLGAVIGGTLAVFGLMASLLAVPVLLAVAWVLVARLTPEPAGEETTVLPPRVSPRDARVWPFLVAGFGMFTALGFVQVLTGFIIQDRFSLSSEATGLATGGSLLAAGIGLALAQAAVVPRTGWGPPVLLRVGSAVALLGFLLLLPTWGLAGVFVSLMLIGFGLGIATPGYTAGPSLLVTREEQGGLAGLIGMNNGLTFILAPVLSTFAYRLNPLLPIAIGAAVMALVVVFVTLHPGVRRAAITPSP